MPGFEYCSAGYPRRCVLTGDYGPGTCTNIKIGDSCNPCLPRPSEPNYTPPPECNGGTPTPAPTATPIVPTPTITPTITPTVTPTPTIPPIAPSCIAIKAYGAGWTELTLGQLSSLSPTTINFCVSASAASGTFDKAQFMINTILKPETTVKRPASSDFCQSYTILSTDTTVSVKAKIHHSSGIWVGESF